MTTQTEYIPDYTPRTTCRLCGGKELDFLFTLGNQYVSDFPEFPYKPPSVRCPIEIMMCRDCTLVQQWHTARQDFLYTHYYWYRSGVTQTMRDALRDVTAAAERLVDLKPGDVVLDIGSNDGTLLRSYTVPGIVRVGVEPANNLAKEGREGVDVFVNDFWDARLYFNALVDQLAPYVAGPKAKIVTACGMLYDLEDPSRFIADVAKVLASDGVFIAQLMCLKQTILRRDVGNFAHEHLEFYSLNSLGHLFSKHGLVIFRVEENDINGGSYRLFIKHCSSGEPDTIESSVVQAYTVERRIGLDKPMIYALFFKELEENKFKVIKLVRDAIERGEKVWVYGASTKGNVILQYYDLGPELIEAAADRSPEKWGKCTVNGIPIKSEEDFRKAAPKYALVLPYAFLPEFIERESAWRAGGGKFIVPLPDFWVV